MRTGRPRLYDDKLYQVKDLHSNGYTIREIAEMVGISRATVHRMVRRTA